MHTCMPSNRIAELAVQSLIEEVHTTPKPGLVDCMSTGSHRDMDIPMFEASAQALYPYFSDLTRLGMSWNGNSQALFPDVRLIGQQAEAAMFKATAGVNTHKGALFSLGILCTACGQAINQGGHISPRRLCSMASAMTQRTLSTELKILKGKTPASHGERTLHRYGNDGIRGEVMRGFPSVLHHGIPVFNQFSNKSDNARNVKTLLSLMANVDDTNVLSRGGKAGLSYVQATAHKLQLMKGWSDAKLLSKLEELDEKFIEQNLSSGGVADLLAVTLFLKKVQQCDELGGCHLFNRYKFD